MAILADFVAAEPVVIQRSLPVSPAVVGPVIDCAYSASDTAVLELQNSRYFGGSALGLNQSIYPSSATLVTVDPALFQRTFATLAPVLVDLPFFDHALKSSRNCFWVIPALDPAPAII